ncbi:hypothetical protein L9F63_006449, partial [Diploptera punctata]
LTDKTIEMIGHAERIFFVKKNIVTNMSFMTYVQMKVLLFTPTIGQHGRACRIMFDDVKSVFVNRKTSRTHFGVISLKQQSIGFFHYRMYISCISLIFQKFIRLL